MTATADPVAPTDRRIGRRLVKSLGQPLNVVEHPYAGCPACSRSGPLEVYARAVRWPCGHTRDIPRIDPSCYKGCYHNRGRVRPILRKVA